jgi:hypothetical protein
MIYHSPSGTSNAHHGSTSSRTPTDCGSVFLAAELPRLDYTRRTVDRCFWQLNCRGSNTSYARSSHTGAIA